MLLTVVQAAKELQCHTETLRRLIREDKIPVYRFTEKLTRVDVEEVKKAFFGRKRKSKYKPAESANEAI